MRKLFERGAGLTCALLVCALAGFAQNQTGTLRGQVADQAGAVIVGATVSVADANNVTRMVSTNAEGVYIVSGLAPGKYGVRATARDFATSESTEVLIVAGGRQTLDFKLTVELKNEEITVSVNNAQLNTEPENNANTMVLRGSDLDALSDDPDQLAGDLRAMAGTAEGPDGVRFYVDGFASARPPSKSSIREVRINANPFAADQETIGFGRVDIFTKPGSDKMHGQVGLNFNDESLDARSPFVATRAPFQARIYSGSLSGPLIAKKASYFLDFERREIDENAYLVATVLDAFFNPNDIRQTVITPQRRTNFSARLDYQLNPDHTLALRYNHLRTGLRNAGVGGFSLLSRAYDTATSEHLLQATETAVVSPTVLNETRFQFVQTRRDDEGDNSVPTINVQGAFVSGGSQIGLAFNSTRRYELQNSTTWVRSRHTWKAGGRLRGVYVTDESPNNFGGTYVFTSLDQYRQVLQGAAGARPAQFTIAGDNPLASVSRTDFSLFAQDDWRIRPNFTLSLGLRYEAQTNIDAKADLAPRAAFAWAPGVKDAAKPPKTVIRGGFGIFYSRFGEDLTLQARRFDGSNQLQFIIDRPDFFPRVPTVSELAAGAQPQTVWRVAEGLKSPYSLRATVSVERQLPLNTKLSVTYYYVHNRRTLRARNLNAPLPGTFNPDDPSSGVRPFGDAGNIFGFEGSGVGTDNNLLINVNGRLNPKISFFGFYALSREFGSSEGPYTFPADPYRLEQEYARASFDFTSFGIVGVNFTLPRGFTWNVLARASSPNRFNITTGRDTNGDAVFAERPAFATDLGRPGVVVTRFGAFDTNPAPGRALIPRNFGKGHGIMQLNMRLSKVINFGWSSPAPAAAAKPPAAGARPAAPVRRESKYNLTLSVEAVNLLNNTNYGPVIGNLSSPLFGQPITTVVTQRRFYLQARFGF